MVADVERGGRAQFPPSIDELLHSDHGSRFFVRVVEGLDRSKLKAEYSPNLGRTSYTPAVLLHMWIYGYVNGASSSRKLKEATWLMVESDKQDEADLVAGDATRSSSDVVDPSLVERLIADMERLEGLADRLDAQDQLELAKEQSRYDEKNEKREAHKHANGT